MPNALNVNVNINVSRHQGTLILGSCYPSANLMLASCHSAALLHISHLTVTLSISHCREEKQQVIELGTFRHSELTCCSTGRALVVAASRTSWLPWHRADPRSRWVMGVGEESGYHGDKTTTGRHRETVLCVEKPGGFISYQLTL